MFKLIGIKITLCWRVWVYLCQQMDFKFLLTFKLWPFLKKAPSLWYKRSNSFISSFVDFVHFTYSDAYIIDPLVIAARLIYSFNLCHRCLRVKIFWSSHRKCEKYELNFQIDCCDLKIQFIFIGDFWFFILFYSYLGVNTPTYR